MSVRKVILVTGETYHIYNHSAQGVPIFKNTRECLFFLESLRYYLQTSPPVRFSIYRRNKDIYPVDLSSTLATTICYCLMPSHFHLILRQLKEDGIKQLIQNLSNSFAHYYSQKYKTRGHLFEGNFKAVRIESDEQLLHLSRYIHLNPVTAYLTERPEDYPFSSYRIFMGQECSDFVFPEVVLNFFSSKEGYKKFVLDQKNYQRFLQEARYLSLD